MSQEIVNALNEVDGFHRNCRLFFDDIVASIRQNTLTGSIRDLVSPETWCTVQSANRSEHRGNFVFDHDARMRFVFMLVKTHENYLLGRSPGFKAICQQLDVNVLFPLLLVTGRFEPVDVPHAPKPANVYRDWLDSTLLLSVHPNMLWPDPMNYALGKLIEIPGGDGTQWYEKARFTIRRLTDIRDSQAVEKIVAELLRL